MVAVAGGRQARGDRQAHGVLDGNIKRLHTVARQVNGVAAEGVAHGKVDRHPVLTAVREQYGWYIFTRDKADGMDIGKSSQHHALQIPLLAAAGGQQTQDVAESSVQSFDERNSA